MDIGAFLKEFLASTGIANFFKGDGWMNLVMILIGCVFLYLAIKKDFEPYLLIPISFGIILVNLLPEIYITYNDAGEIVSRGLLGYLHIGVECELYPCLIFLGIGATTDFGPLIANKKTMLLGAAAQIGIFVAFFGALFLGFNFFEAASIGIIGGADGPTAILTSNRLLTISGSTQYLAPIALAAYSYMALVPIIFPPIIRLLTTKEERLIKMEQLREVSKKEKILFPIIITLIVSLIVPSATPLIGCFMLGNLIKECEVVPNLTNIIANALLYICTVLLGLSVGATAQGTSFLTIQTLSIFALGIFAFVVACAFGIWGGKVMCKLTHGKVNPMIGAAGVSAVPMAARVVQKEGQREDPSNFLLMHAMGPNVAGVIGSAIAAGILLTFFG
jgi:carboxybiotin decarboxylase